MAKAKKPSLLDLARVVKREIPNWTTKMPADDLVEVLSVISAFKRGELPNWSIKFMHVWLKDKLPTFTPGISQFQTFVKAYTEGDN